MTSTLPLFIPYLIPSQRMACRSGCCDPPVKVGPEQVPQAQSLIRGGLDRCSDEKNLTAGQACKDACCSNKETGHPAITKSASRQDTCCTGPSGRAKEGDCCDSNTKMEDDGCTPPDTVSADCQNGCWGEPTKEPQGGVGCGRKDIKV